MLTRSMVEMARYNKSPGLQMALISLVSIKELHKCYKYCIIVEPNGI